MKNLFILTISIFIFIGCSNESSQKINKSTVMIDVPVTLNKIEVGSIDAVKTIAELEIEGMTCAIGCAKTIKKTLGDLDGVTMAEVDFDAEKPVDIAIVNYNPSILSELEMAAKIQSLADGQYKVNKIVVNKYIYAESLKEEIIEKDKTSVIDVKFSFPNILEVFTLI